MEKFVYHSEWSFETGIKLTRKWRKGEAETSYNQSGDQ
jgi:hypothetical protein